MKKTILILVASLVMTATFSQTANIKQSVNTESSIKKKTDDPAWLTDLINYSVSLMSCEVFPSLKSVSTTINSIGGAYDVSISTMITTLQSLDLTNRQTTQGIQCCIATMLQYLTCWQECGETISSECNTCLSVLRGQMHYCSLFDSKPIPLPSPGK